MTAPDISVVIPVYNKEQEVERCIKSVLGQSVRPCEVIVIDDASSDRSMEVVRKMADEGFRFISRRVPGAGGYAARNAGIEVATSHWIAFLDADDRWLPNHIETLQKLTREAHADTSIVFTGYTIEEGPGSKEVCIRGDGLGYFTGLDLLERWAAGGIPLWTGALAARRDLLLARGLFPEGRCRRGGDKDLWLRLIINSSLIGTSTKTAVYQRNSNNMVTREISHAVPHCVNDTIVALLSHADVPTKKALARIYLNENIKYFKATALEGSVPECEIPRDISRLLPLRSFWAALVHFVAARYGLHARSLQHLRRSG